MLSISDTRPSLKPGLASLDITDGKKPPRNEIESDELHVGTALDEADYLKGVKQTIRSGGDESEILIPSEHCARESRATLLIADGASDFILKPFDLRDMKLRIRAAVRPEVSSTTYGNFDISIGCLSLDVKNRNVTTHRGIVPLTPKESRLLYSLMASAGRPIPHAELLRAMRGPGFESHIEYLRTFIAGIRKKIEENPSDPKYMLTHARLGYRFARPGELRSIQRNESSQGDTKGTHK
jgi:DNA-binding response OmpR family regulator